MDQPTTQHAKEASEGEQEAGGPATARSPTLMNWLMLRGRDVVAPLVLNPVVPFEPRLPPPQDLPSRGCVSVRHHVVQNQEENAGTDNEKHDGETKEEEGRRKIRVVSLNMEMGKRMGDIIADMVRLQPDVVLLQEVDLVCPRSGNVDGAGEIAHELGMSCVFACEVEDPSKFPGEAEKFEAGGRQGNAILSRFPVKAAWPVLVTCRKDQHSHTAYKTHAEAAAVLATPRGDLLCYSVHFDPHFAGVDGRIAQYFEVLDDAKLHYAPRHASGSSSSSLSEAECDLSASSDEEGKAPYALIAGDFNTVTTGIARLAPSIGWTKSSWWTTLGWTEAEWFDVHGVQRGNAEKQLDFADPFDKRRDSTFDGLGKLYQAKLDWCLLSDGLSVVHKEVGPSRSCSDHNWICVDVIMEDGLADPKS